MDLLIKFLNSKRQQKLDQQAEQAFLEIIRYRNVCPNLSIPENRAHIDHLYRVFDTKKLSALEYAEKHQLESMFFEPHIPQSSISNLRSFGKMQPAQSR